MPLSFITFAGENVDLDFNFDFKPFLNRPLGIEPLPPMLLSMTGFGKAVAKYNDKTIHVEVKALNSKALDCSCRIAPAYREKEMEIRKMILESAVRGKVDFAIWVEKETSTDAQTINIPLFSNYYQQLLHAADEAGMTGLQAGDTASTAQLMQLIMRMPDVMTHSEPDDLSDEEWHVVAQAVTDALDALTAFRIQEGEALRRKFEEKLTNIATLMASVEPYEKNRVEKIRQRLVDNLKAIPDVQYDQNRLEQEMIYYLEKLDISEEKQRLANHLQYFRDTMDEEWNPAATGGKSQGIGKKLGFIAQEMGREINTTGSKSNQAEMQNIVVQMKDELEQIKEQVLNAL